MLHVHNFCLKLYPYYTAEGSAAGYIHAMHPIHN